MRRIVTLALMALTALAQSGCINIGVTVGEEIPAELVSQIVPGKTTKGEILKSFGAPDQYTDAALFARLFDIGEIAAEDLVALPFSDLLVYEIDDVNAHVLITVLFNWVRADMLRDRLVIYFDENDVVLYYGITRQRDELPWYAPSHRSKELDPMIKQQRERL
jgi:hypothetical protein